MMKDRVAAGFWCLLVAGVALHPAAFGQTAIDDKCSKLAKKMESPDYEQRWDALFGYAALGSTAPCVVPAIARALADPEFKLRTAASDVLGKFGPSAKAAVPALVKAIATKEDLAHPAYTHALASIDDPAWPAVPLLIEELHGEAYRRIAIEALGKLGPRAKAAIPELIRILKLKKDNQCASSFFGTAQFTGTCAEDAAIALGEIGPEAAAAVPTLIELMNSPYPDFMVVVEDMAKMAQGQPVPIRDEAFLKEKQNEIEWHVEKVETALLRIHTPEAVKAVEQYRKHKGLPASKPN